MYELEVDIQTADGLMNTLGENTAIERPGEI